MTIELRHRRPRFLAIVAFIALGWVGLPRVLSAEDVRDNLVILLDSSGSMNERLPGTRQDKMSAAKSALTEVLRQLPPTTHVGLIVFGGRGIRDPWVYPLGPREDARLFNAIDSMRADGGTPLGAYMKRAADRLLEERTRQFGYGTFRLLIVSDGEAQDQDLVEKYTPEILARGIVVDVIGVAMAQQHTLATKVHSYRVANDPASLRRALGEVLAELAGAGTDLAGADAFAMLAPIPLDVAGAALQALTTIDNSPIGEQPRSPRRVPADETTTTVPQAPSAPASAPTPTAGPASPPGVPSEPPRRVVGLAWGGVFCFGGALLLILFLVRALVRSARRRRS